MSIREFISNRLVRCVGSMLPFREFVIAYLESLPPRERMLWPRWRCLAECQALGLVVVKYQKIDNLVGVALIALDTSPVVFADAVDPQASVDRRVDYTHRQQV